MLDEVFDHLKANLAPPDVAVALPVPVNSPLVIVDGLALVTLAHCQAGELKIDHAASLLAFEQRIEVDGSLLNTTG